MFKSIRYNVVKFRDGTYGVRDNGFLRIDRLFGIHYYVDVKKPFDYKWGLHSSFFEDCKTTKEKAIKTRNELLMAPSEDVYDV